MNVQQKIDNEFFGIKSIFDEPKNKSAGTLVRMSKSL